jgi:hypothetical protein
MLFAAKPWAAPPSPTKLMVTGTSIMQSRWGLITQTALTGFSDGSSHLKGETCGVLLTFTTLPQLTCFLTKCNNGQN